MNPMDERAFLVDFDSDEIWVLWAAMSAMLKKKDVGLAPHHHEFAERRWVWLQEVADRPTRGLPGDLDEPARTWLQRRLEALRQRKREAADNGKN